MHLLFEPTGSRGTSPWVCSSPKQAAALRRARRKGKAAALKPSRSILPEGCGLLHLLAAFNTQTGLIWPFPVSSQGVFFPKHLPAVASSSGSNTKDGEGKNREA